MPMFRKKPIIIEAWQYNGEGASELRGVCQCHPGERRAHLHTMHEGQIVELKVGDWITREPVPDRYYPIKPDVFEKTYAPFHEHSQAVCSADDVRALMEAMGLFPSVIRSGEQWTPTCETVKENAMAALGRIRSSLTN